ncbi:hypothetical protein EDB83DRAFT_2552154 [Lactarius deliciosus]|nr:hypothetical protein EDB83DRAFT_2552154 [Lactarius deliciosus]
MPAPATAVSTESNSTSSTETCLIQAGFSLYLNTSAPGTRIPSNTVLLSPTISPPRLAHHLNTNDFAADTYTVALLLGGAVPESVRVTVDSTYYTHYPSLSTVEINWGLGSLGCGDMNKTLSNVYSFVATGYTNLDVSLADIPLMNITGTIPGPLNVQYYVTAPNTSAGGAGGGPVFRLRHQLYHRLRANLVAQGKTCGSAHTLRRRLTCRPVGAAIALGCSGGHRATVLVLGGLLAGVAAILA